MTRAIRHALPRGEGRRRGRAASPQRSPTTRPATHPERREQRRFVLTFIGTAVLLFSVYSFPYDGKGEAARLFARYLAAYARVAGFFLGGFDSSIAVHGPLITGRFTLQIVKSCDAMEASLLFISAIVAWPAGSWGSKVVAGGLGLGAISALNIVRICTLYAIGIHMPQAFELFHIDLWPLLLVVAAGGAFVGAALWMRRPPGRSLGSPRRGLASPP